MKKRITYVLLTVFIALSLVIPTFADEATMDIVEEVVTDTLVEVATPEATETEATETESTELDEEHWEEFKDKITDSATWTMIGTALLTIITFLGTMKSTLTKIRALVHNKADNETLQGAIKDVEKDLKEAFNTNYKEIADTLKRYEEALKNTDENEQKLYAVLTLFMTNCKISESARTEILGIMQGVKKYEGATKDILEKVQEAIDKGKEENKKNAPPTPSLDKLLEDDYMKLG